MILLKRTQTLEIIITITTNNTKTIKKHKLQCFGTPTKYFVKTKS